MAEVTKSIEVPVDVTTAYNQWTQFESFPQFMEGVQEIRQIDEKHLHWKAEIGGKVEEWDAEITEQIPDDRIAWRATNGAPNAGVVTFHHIAENESRVTLQLEYAPQGLAEKVGEALGFMDRQVQKDLERFRDLLTTRGAATGGYRGEIHNN
ncbi:MAG: SRPBCC family protein [Candidatus Dormibacteraeota bacterium]|nr:SRPBCC family protein [Candidatus Dormibacteraeota bacterium]